MASPTIQQTKTKLQDRALYDAYLRTAIAQIILGVTIVAMSIAGAVMTQGYALYVSLVLVGGLVNLAAGILGLCANEKLKKASVALSVVGSACCCGTVLWDFYLVMQSYQGTYVLLALILVVGTGATIISAYSALLQPLNGERDKKQPN